MRRLSQIEQNQYSRLVSHPTHSRYDLDSVKLNLVQNMSNRILTFVSPEFPPADLNIFKDAFMKNRYPKSFVKLHNEGKKNIRHQTDQPKHSVYLKMQYRGESGAKLLRKRQAKTEKKNCKESQLSTIFTSRPLFTLQSRDRQTKQTISIHL